MLNLFEMLILRSCLQQEIADGALGEGGANKIGRLGLNDLIFLFTGN